ncbi:hypothetical protein CBF17_000620 [Pantoea agglomerans]|uniref:hypothetical protein n=1 Tax=Enterobacter agglomerans TaxID=549 RepID=UPI000C0812B5|nr:hypothetical protein [Pantoea agglomerans]PHP95704.1 hypothetical protein CBF17_000620 [Pantoea agglomerans]
MTEQDMQLLRDVLIGEATLAILNDNTRVSWPGILNKLNSFLKTESNTYRIDALKLAINDVSDEIKRRDALQRSGMEEFTMNSTESYDDLTWH